MCVCVCVCVCACVCVCSECWTPLKSDLDKLDRFHHANLRSILGISRGRQWEQHITSEQLRAQWGDPTPLSCMVQRRRLEWLGHLARLDDNRLPKQLLFAGYRTGHTREARRYAFQRPKRVGKLVSLWVTLQKQFALRLLLRHCRTTALSAETSGVGVVRVYHNGTKTSGYRAKPPTMGHRQAMISPSQRTHQPNYTDRTPAPFYPSLIPFAQP